MATVKVKASGPLVRLFIDGVKLQLSGTSAEKDVSAGEHVMSWVIRGAPGSSYSVAITAPAASAFSKEAVLDSTMLDAGLHFFQTS